MHILYKNYIECYNQEFYNAREVCMVLIESQMLSLLLY